MGGENVGERSFCCGFHRKEQVRWLADLELTRLSNFSRPGAKGLPPVVRHLALTWLGQVDSPPPVLGTVKGVLPGTLFTSSRN